MYPKTLNDLRAAETLVHEAPNGLWDKFDRAFLATLVISAILAIVAFAYVVLTFVH